MNPAIMAKKLRDCADALEKSPGRDTSAEIVDEMLDELSSYMDDLTCEDDPDIEEE